MTSQDMNFNEARHVQIELEHVIDRMTPWSRFKLVIFNSSDGPLYILESVRRV
jgi:hypothetical protein